MNMAASKDALNGKLVLAMVVAIALTCGLCPGFASAAQLEAGQVAQASAQAGQAERSLSPQATKTVYVITGTKAVADYGTKSVTTTKFTYNKYGLLTKRAGTNNLDGKTAITYTYKGATLKSKKKTGFEGTSTTKYTFKKGLNTKAVQVSNQPSGAKLTRTYTGAYKGKYLVKKASTNVIKVGDQKSTTKDTFSYAYKSGRVALRNWSGSKVTYAYDTSGNLINIGGSPYENTYNKYGFLTKKTQSEEGYEYAIAYTYKAMKVNAALADTIAAQQWAIINSNLNFAFGIDEG